MARDRFTLIEGGKGRKPKRRRSKLTECGRCRGRAYLVVYLPTEQADGSEGPPRRHKACAQRFTQGRVELL